MKADGGAAFPRAPFEVNDYCGDGSPGMSLRDYYIGQVMPALIITFGHDDGYDREGAAAEAGKLADAMLAERERSGDEG